MMNTLKQVWEYVVKFWIFLWYDDSALSYFLNFIVAFIFIKYIFFPGLGFVLNNDYPIVAIVSGSMEHKIVPEYNSNDVFKYSNICNVQFSTETRKSLGFDDWWNYCGAYYSNYNLAKSDFESFEYKNGLNIGDVMILYGKDPKDIQIGEILVFIPQDEQFFRLRGPVIHRVVEKWTDDMGVIHFRTKGDHNPVSMENFENDITEDKVIGTAMLRVPYLGWAKILLSQSLMGIVNLVR